MHNLEKCATVPAQSGRISIIGEGIDTSKYPFFHYGASVSGGADSGDFDGVGLCGFFCGSGGL